MIKRIPANYYKLIPVVFLILFIGIAPFGDALYNSFFHDFFGERSFVGIDNYKHLTQDRAFKYSLNITVVWALLNAVLSLVLGFFLAVKLSEKRIFSNLLFGMLLIPWGIPVYIAVPLWRALLHGNGGESILTFLFGIRINLLIDPVASFLSILAVSLWMTVPLTAFVFLGALKKLPKTVTEAAKIDGASRAEIACYLYLPHIRDSLLAMGILNFIKAFKEFTVIFLLTSGGPPLISGITDRHIIGATTTVGMFLYEIFTETDDLGITSVYSVVLGGIVILTMGIWIIIKGGVKSYRKNKIITALFQIIFSGKTGFIWACGYLAGLKKDIFFLITAILQVVISFFLILKSGFLNAFHPGILMAVFALFLRRKTKKRTLQINRLLRPLWEISSNATSFLMIILSAALLYLLVWMSLSAVSSCYIDSIIPSFFTFKSFQKVIFEDHIFKYFLNTFIISAITGVLIPVITFPAASFLSNRGRAFTYGFLTFIQVVAIAGGMHSLIPLYSIFRKIGMINSYTPLILIYLNHSIFFSIFTITAFLENIPTGLKDQAAIEGMSSFSYMTKILFPLSIPVIITSVIVAFLNAWNGFTAPLLFLNDDLKYTISIKLYSYVGNIASGSQKWNLFAAASIINCILISLLFIKFKNPIQNTPVSEYDE